MGLAEFRERHPWPAKYRALGRPREWLWWFDLPGTPEDLWPYLTDTARTNRASGLGEMHYSEHAGELHGWHRTAGVRHDFVERWQWSAPRRAELVREYSTGLAHLLRQLYVLEPRGDGASRFYVYTAWIPRGLVGPVAVRIGMRWFEARYRAVVGRMIDAMRRAAPLHEVTRMQPPRLDDERRRRLATLKGELRRRGVDGDALDRLIALAESGDEIELDRIRVRQLARDWRIDERRLLVAALHATRGGLLELTWDIMCPHCRGVRSKLKTLGDIPERERCDACSIEFGTDRENAIEVTFRIHPSIRPLEGAVYCSAQPVKRGHIRLSQEIGAGESRPVETSLAPGRYRARRRGEEVVAPLVVRPDGPTGEVVHWSAAGAPDRVDVGPAPTFDLSAGEGAPTTFVVEEIEWDAGALEPADLFNLQEFRDLFNEQYLAAGVKLHIGEQTVLFTDIVGSTKFYADVGDPTAFVEVKKHFAEVYASVAAQNGAVVKTIGDAVMAAFSDPIAAVRTACEVHQKFPGNPGLRLRVSINTGPCIAVNLNSGIDYFGGTVNTAAKLQRCADAGEVALSATTLAAPGVQGTLAQLGGPLRSTQLNHDALGLLQVTVWRPPPA